MKLSVLINNYNYAKFLPETIAKVRGQSLTPHEIIVIDDGSTDESVAVLERLGPGTPVLRSKTTVNGGQLAAFRAGVNLATGDYCCFLDADDIWEPNHLAEAHEILSRHPRVGFYYSGHTKEPGGIRPKQGWPDGEFGPLAGLVSATGERVGSITSTLVLHRQLAKKLVDTSPDLDRDWRSRADDCLCLGAGIAGALIYYNPTVTVIHRLHGENNYTGKKHDDYDHYVYDSAKNRIIQSYMSKFGIRSDKLLSLVWHEYETFPANRKTRHARDKFQKALARTPSNFRDWIKIQTRNLFNKVKRK